MTYSHPFLLYWSIVLLISRFFHNGIHFCSKTQQYEYGCYSNAARTVHFVVVELVRIGAFAAGHQQETDEYQHHATYHPHIVAFIEQEILVAFGRIVVWFCSCHIAILIKNFNKGRLRAFSGILLQSGAC